MYGKIIGDFELIQLINRGGMAEIYKARRRSDGNLFAIRLMITENVSASRIVKEFVNACHIPANLDHPNILKVIEIRDELPQPYAVLEFVEGDNLKQAILKREDIVVNNPLLILAGIAEGINYLHGMNVIHRDIKPENILVSGGADVKIADFGLAMEKKNGEVITRSISGSPSYLAPEIILEKKYSEATDIYSFGITAYELLTGRPPYEGRTEQEIMEKHIDQAISPKPIREANPAVPENLERIIMKLLEKSSQQRYPHMNLFIRDLKTITLRS